MARSSWSSLQRAAFLGAALAAAVAAAPAARADELYATVERTAAPGERALVRVRADAPGPVALAAFRVEGVEAFLAALDPADGEAAYRRLRPLVDGAHRAARREPTPAVAPAADGPPPAGVGLTFVVSATAVLAAPRGPAGVAEGVTPLPEATVEVPLPSAGLYVVEVVSGRLATGVVALVSRLALVTKRDPKGVLAFCVDRTTGHAIDGARVEVRAGGTVVAAGATDADGLLRVEAALPSDATVVAASADHWALATEPYAPADVADRRVHVATHQPAYRPGETVACKGIVRAWRDGAYALDADLAEVTVRFLAAGDRELGRVVAPVSADLGTFVASAPLPADAPLGDGRVVVEAGRRAWEGTFRIEAYRTPTAEVRVAGTPAQATPGADLRFDVTGALFQGGALADAPFTWTLAYHRVDRDLFPTDELARLFFGTEREAYAAETVAQGEGRLDAAGRATVPCKAPTRPLDGFLTLRVVATAPDRTVAAGAGTVGFAAAPLVVALRTDKHLYGAEGVARVTVRARRADGTPAAGRAGVVTASLVGEGPGGAREERVAGAWPVTTGPDGAAVVDVPFPEQGRYAVSVAVPRAADEPAGPPAHAVVHAWVVGDRADVGFSGDHVELVADRDTYRVGDVARVLVLAPVGARPCLSTVEGARLLAADTVPLGGADDRAAAAVVEVRIGPEHVPGVYVGAALVDHGHLLATTRLLRVPPVDRLLVPTVAAAKAELEPGETVELTAKVVDAAGAPVAGAEVAVAIVDDALYALYADPFPPLAPFFHPVRRNDVRTGSTLDLGSVGFAVQREARKQLEAAAGEDAAGSGGAPAPSAAAPSAAPGSPPVGAPAGRPAPERARDDDGADRGLWSGEEGGELNDAPKKARAGGGEGPLATREDFRTSVLWSPTLRTGADGLVALGPVTFAETLTRWRISAHAVDATTRVGSSVTTVTTSKRLQTRVTLPRFLRRGDRVVAPWLTQNLTAGALEGDVVASATTVELVGPTAGRLALPSGRVTARDLTLDAPRLGTGSVRVEVRSKAGGDAMAAKVPVLPQGVPTVRVATASGEGGAVTLAPLSLPASAEPGTARLVVSVVPSVAQAVGAALPYLADYPYGCTEQTVSRLVPVVVAKAARDRFGVPLTGRLAELPAMLEQGLARLRALQHEDGGFGWWEADRSDLYMTAYVVHGLARAREVMDDAAPADALVARAVPWLTAAVAAADAGAGADGATLAFARSALADAGALPAAAQRDPPAGGAPSPLAAAFAVRAAVAAGAPARAAPWVAALEGQAVRDAAGVRWVPTGDPTRWAGDPVETTAWVGGALLAVAPGHADLPGVVRWLLAQRSEGDRWRSTRDTAACVAFLTRFVAATGDLGADRRVDLDLNGLRLAPVIVTPATAFSGAGVLELPAESLPKGEIRLTATSEGPVTVTAALRFTDTGPAIDAADAGLTVTRTFWLLEPGVVDGKPVVHRRPVTETVPSGALLDVEVTVTTATPREFVQVTSPFVAGFEPERELGLPFAAPPAAAGPVSRTEVHDDRAVFFVARLAGTQVFRHRVRAVHVGQYTALPAAAELMYLPTVAGHGRGEALEVRAAGPAGAATEGR